MVPRRGTGCFRPTGRDGDCTPHSLLSCQKRMRRARWKRKTLGPKSFPVGQVWADGGRASRCPRDWVVSYRVRLSLREQRSASPHLGAWVLLSGWSSNGLFFSFHAPRFAQHCRGRKLRQASARLAERQRRVEAGQIGLATPTHGSTSSRAHD